MNKFPPYVEFWYKGRKSKFYLYRPVYLGFRNSNIRKLTNYEKESLCFRFTGKEVVIYARGSSFEAASCSLMQYRTKTSLFITYKGLTIFIDGLGEASDFSFHGFFSKSEAGTCLLDEIKRVTREDDLVFIVGNTGTGKEFIAKNIHYNSRRKNCLFSVVSCSLMQDEHIFVNLFGAEKGAYTNSKVSQKGVFFNTNKGTVFIDEISELSVNLQGVLNRLIEQKELKALGNDKVIHHNARIIISSSICPYELMYAKLLREDLFYRISKNIIYVPDLSERKEDLPLLVEFFLQGSSKQISHKDLDMFTKYKWPGNIRELKNTVLKAIITSDCDNLNFEFLQNSFNEKDLSNKFINTRKLKDYAGLLVNRVIKRNKGNIYRSAEVLDVDVNIVKKYL